jgi:hypothetical protein
MPNNSSFLQALLHDRQREQAAATAAQNRKRELQPLAAAYQRIHDTLLGLTGVYLPPMRMRRLAAAALWRDFCAFRTALDAAGNADALDAIQLGLLHWNEGQ